MPMSHKKKLITMGN